MLHVKPYNDFNTYLREHFGARVYKVTIDAGFTCPNRDGTLARGGCLYCNPHGSGNAQHKVSIREQVLKGIKFVKYRFRAEKIIVYFQAFTNTYAPADQLEAIYKEALCHPDIVALAIGTRPDCIDEQKLNMLSQFSKEYEVWMEYGLESSHDRTLTLINRLHTFKHFEDAVKMTQKYPFKVCTHTIMGLPGESRADMIQTIERIIDLKLDAIKIHNLYIEKKTGLAQYYEENPFPLMSQEEYVDLVCDILEMLPPEMVVERLTGDPLKDFFYLPDWGLLKQRTLVMIEREMARRGVVQGHRFLYNKPSCRSGGMADTLA